MTAECLEPRIFESNEVQTEIVDLSITKTPSCGYAIPGGTICYTIVAENNSEVDMFGVLFSDVIPANTTYIVDSFMVDGVQQTPMMAENTIQELIDIPAGESVTITFCVKIN